MDAAFGLSFMTEIGQAFNKDDVPADPAKVEHLYRAPDAVLAN